MYPRTIPTATTGLSVGSGSDTSAGSDPGSEPMTSRLMNHAAIPSTYTKARLKVLVTQALRCGVSSSPVTIRRNGSRPVELRRTE